MAASVSLTQETSLREVDNLRQQIYRIKGGSTVSAPFSCGVIHRVLFLTDI